MRSRIGLHSAVAAIVLAIVAAAFFHPPAWGLFGLSPFQPNFGDLIAILAAGQAWVAGLDIYAPIPFDPHQRPHVYGPGWLVTGLLGLDVTDTGWVGILVVVAFVVAAVKVLNPRGINEAIVVVLTLCSPPMMLAINRANNDAVVFLFLASAAWLLSRPGIGATIAGSSLWALAATLKLYPFAALPMLVMRRKRIPVLIGSAAVAFVVAVVAVAYWWSDFQKVFAIAPRPDNLTAYGIRMLRILWLWARDQHPVLVAGWTAGAVTGIVVLWRHRRAFWTAVPTTGGTSIAFVAGAACWIFCYVTNSNYPYRAVVLLLVARPWLEETGSHRSGRLQLILWLTVFWLGLPIRWWIEWFELQRTVDSIRVMLSLVSFQEGLATLLTLALAVSLAGVLFRRGRELRADATVAGISETPPTPARAARKRRRS